MGGGGPESPPVECVLGFLNNIFIMSNLHVISTCIRKQDCIPVGCVPPACYPYLSACTVLGGAWSQRVSWFRGGEVPASGPRGCISACNGADHPPVNRMTYRQAGHQVIGMVKKIGK